MDTLSHGLWALAIFWGTSYRWWAFLLGMIPDLLSFGFLFVTRIFSSGFHLGRPGIESIPHWVYSAYDVTHSFLTWILIGALLYVFWRKYYLIVIAPMAHIALDIPTHCSFFPTPFLWPVSSYRYCGQSWGTPWIFTLNWMCLAIVFSLIILYERQRRTKKTLPAKESLKRKRASSRR